MSVQRIWMTKFYSGLTKFNIFAAYFIVQPDKFFKITPNDWHVQKDFNISVPETLWNFIGHSVLLGESFHRTELISVWLWVYIVYIVFEAISDISVRLEMRQIGPITYLSCRSDGPMNLADTATSCTCSVWQKAIKPRPWGIKGECVSILPSLWPTHSHLS